MQLYNVKTSDRKIQVQSPNDWDVTKYALSSLRESYIPDERIFTINKVGSCKNLDTANDYHVKTNNRSFNVQGIDYLDAIEAAKIDLRLKNSAVEKIKHLGLIKDYEPVEMDMNIHVKWALILASSIAGIVWFYLYR